MPPLPDSLTEVIAAKVSKDTRREVDAVCALRGISMAQFLREAVEAALVVGMPSLKNKSAMNACGTHGPKNDG